MYVNYEKGELMSEDFLFVEKYRPKTVEDIILPNRLKDVFTNIIKTGEVPNMMLSGTAGLGKTTVAKAICNELNLDYIIINGSEDGNIDTLRGKIKQFASSVSLNGGYKVVILDEADYLNPQSTQPALRGFIEEFSNNCRFILTCNYKNRIIKPIHSRCGVYDFTFQGNEKQELASKFMIRLKSILEKEKIEYNDKVIVELILKYAPDWRRILNEVQRGSIGGQLTTEVLLTQSTTISTLMAHLKKKDFQKIRTWVANNMDVEPQSIYRDIYDNASTYAELNSVPQIILTLADYQYKDSFVADHELNMVACMTELMRDVVWK